MIEKHWPLLLAFAFGILVAQVAQDYQEFNRVCFPVDGKTTNLQDRAARP